LGGTTRLRGERVKTRSRGGWATINDKDGKTDMKEGEERHSKKGKEKSPATGALKEII